MMYEKIQMTIHKKIMMPSEILDNIQESTEKIQHHMSCAINSILMNNITYIFQCIYLDLRGSNCIDLIERSWRGFGQEDSDKRIRHLPFF